MSVVLSTQQMDQTYSEALWVHTGPEIMPWLHVKYNYFKNISAFVDVRRK